MSGPSDNSPDLTGYTLAEQAAFVKGRLYEALEIQRTLDARWPLALRFLWLVALALFALGVFVGGAAFFLVSARVAAFLDQSGTELESRLGPTANAPVSALANEQHEAWEKAYFARQNLQGVS